MWYVQIQKISTYQLEIFARLANALYVQYQKWQALVAPKQESLHGPPNSFAYTNKLCCCKHCSAYSLIRRGGVKLNSTDGHYVHCYATHKSVLNCQGQNLIAIKRGSFCFFPFDNYSWYFQLHISNYCYYFYIKSRYLLPFLVFFKIFAAS